MGSWDQTSHSKILHIKMKFSVVAMAVILALLISSCEGQKGGAKSAMRNRGRGGGRSGQRSMSRNYGDSSSRGADDIFGNGSGRKACVGICYLRSQIIHIREPSVLLISLQEASRETTNG